MCLLVIKQQGLAAAAGSVAAAAEGHAATEEEEGLGELLFTDAGAEAIATVRASLPPPRLKHRQARVSEGQGQGLASVVAVPFHVADPNPSLGPQAPL